MIWRQAVVMAAVSIVAGLAALQDMSAAAVVALSGLTGTAAMAALAILAPAPKEVPRDAQREGRHLRRGAGRYLLDQIPGPLLLIDARGRVAYANSAMRRMLPRLQAGDHHTNLFRSSAFLAGVSDIMGGAAEREVAFTAISGAVEQHLTAKMRRLENETDFDNGPLVLIHLADQTERVAMERMRTDFIANASHELRTPLASIIGYIETLQGHARDDEAARTHFLGTMSQQAARMQRLVEDLMSLSRIEMDAHTPPTARADLAAIVRETAEGMAPLVARREARLAVSIGDGPIMLRADRDQIAQVFTNLMENALRYGGEGGTVDVTRAEPDERFPGMVGISVSDTGPGIAREHIHRLTERFYRVSAKQSRAQGGTGLGLAIVKHILARHGGELDIASTLGKGSRFTVWLPSHDLPEKSVVQPATME